MRDMHQLDSLRDPSRVTIFLGTLVRRIRHPSLHLFIFVLTGMGGNLELCDCS